MNARELICHDSSGDAYWILLFDTRKDMTDRLLTDQTCETTKYIRIDYGENWWYAGGKGDESIGKERIVQALGGTSASELEMLGCPIP
ncbi:MAG: hypothetical protein RL118_189 [Actinomycetota bacterium]